MARKNQVAAVKQDQRACISSSNVSTPSMCSSFYKKRVSNLESNLCLFDAPLTPENYQERFHHLLCWEESEHIKQLANRLVLC